MTELTSCENCIRFKCPYNNKTGFHIGECTSKIELKHKKRWNE